MCPRWSLTNRFARVWTLTDRHLTEHWTAVLSPDISPHIQILTSSKSSLTQGGESTAPPIERYCSYTLHYIVCSQWASTRGVVHWQPCLATTLGDMFMWVSFLRKAPWSSLIYVCIKAPKMYSISRLPVLQHRHAAQLQKHLPAGTWNDILETKLWNIKTRTKEISIFFEDY